MAGNTRSPNFPATDLESAVALTQKLEDLAGKHPVPVSDALNLWGFKPKSSRGLQCVGALRQFGLVTTSGKSDKRQIRLTESARKIVHNHSERPELIREAVAQPKVHQSILNHYGDNLEDIPPDPTLRSFLIFEHEPAFNPSSVDTFLKQFRRTIEFACALVPQDDAEDVKDSDGFDFDDRSEPRREKPGSQRRQEEHRRPPSGGSMNESTFPLEEGIAVLQWPKELSADSFQDFESWVNLTLRRAKRSVVKDYGREADEASAQEDETG